MRRTIPLRTIAVLLFWLLLFGTALASPATPTPASKTVTIKTIVGASEALVDEQVIQLPFPITSRGPGVTVWPLKAIARALGMTVARNRISWGGQWIEITPNVREAKLSSGGFLTLSIMPEEQSGDIAVTWSVFNSLAKCEMRSYPNGDEWLVCDMAEKAALPTPPTHPGQDEEPAADLPADRGLSDIKGHWAQISIVKLIDRKIVAGVGNGLFKPADPLTRAAFVKMLVAARGLELQPGAAGLVDTETHWSATLGYLQAAVKAGIIMVDEYPEGKFLPDRSITRDEIAVMLIRARGILPADMTPNTVMVTVDNRSFVDVKTWVHPGYVLRAIMDGLVSGYQENDGTYTFRPERQATRAEAAVLLVRLLDKQQ